MWYGKQEAAPVKMHKFLKYFSLFFIIFKSFLQPLIQPETSVRRFIAKISGAIIVVVLLILRVWVKRISIIKLVIFNVRRRSR